MNNISTIYWKLSKYFVSMLQERLGKALSSVVLYGSAARGTAGVKSDIDLLIIVDYPQGKKREIEEKVSEIYLDFEDVVRLSQESTELALKSLFMFCGIDFPKEHALGKAIDRLPFTEDELGVKEKREIRKINQQLAKKRVVSFYGAEDGTPAIDIFTEEEACEAISGAKFILETIKRLEVTD